MTNAHRPGLSVDVVPAEVEVAPGVHGEVLEGREFAGGDIDGETLRDRAEIEHERLEQRHGPRLGVEKHVAPRDPVEETRCNARRRGLARLVVAIESTRLHPLADRRIERAGALLSHRERETYRLIEHATHGHRRADLIGQLSQLAFGIEAAATLLDAVKPGGRARDAFRTLRTPGLILSVTDDLNRDDRPHRCDGVDVDVAHFACLSASTIA